MSQFCIIFVIELTPQVFPTSKLNKKLYIHSMWVEVGNCVYFIVPHFTAKNRKMCEKLDNKYINYIKRKVPFIEVMYFDDTITVFGTKQRTLYINCGDHSFSMLTIRLFLRKVYGISKYFNCTMTHVEVDSYYKVSTFTINQIKTA